jgi:hypothetical protein
MSTLKVTNIQATGETATRAVSGVAAAWVNFNQEAVPLLVRDSLNVSSVSDDGTAQSTTNFSSNMANANYSFAFGVSNGTGLNDAPTLNVDSTQQPTTSTFALYSFMDGALNDASTVCATTHGDLA